MLLSPQIYCTDQGVKQRVEAEGGFDGKETVLRARSLLSIVSCLIRTQKITTGEHRSASLSHKRVEKGAPQHAVHERIGAKGQSQFIFNSHSHGDVLRLLSSHSPLLLPQSDAVHPFDPAVIAVPALCQGFIFPSSSFEFPLVPW